MNNIAVISNLEEQKKLPIRHPLLYPKHSFLNPEYTFPVDKKYTAYGMADIVAHALEAFFGSGSSPLSDRFSLSIVKEIMDLSQDLLNHLTDYELRARMMYAATNALNGLTLFGKKTGDWGVHSLGHVLSLLYDTPHGATLSIMYPAWMKCKRKAIETPLKKMGTELFGTDDPVKIIAALTRFFISIHAPVTLEEAGIPAGEKEKIEQYMNENGVGGMVYPLSPGDIDCILTRIIEG